MLRTVMCSIAVLGALGVAAFGGQAALATPPAPKTNANGEIQMLNPHQRIHFNVQRGTLEYWNYDYPGGLHYTSTITCSWIDVPSQQARFMFQIPAGFPGLSGLYVVAYIKIVDAPTKQYLYGHAATSDLPTATQWCQTGTGFAPAMYTVKSGKLYVKNVGANLLMASRPLLR
jgi:hypothetical protein